MEGKEDQLATGFEKSCSHCRASWIHKGIRGIDMAEIVVAEATGKCPETETQAD